MKMTKWFLTAAAITATVALIGCGGTPTPIAPPPAPVAIELEPAPAGTERLFLENGAYAIFRFDLLPGTTWADFSHISAEFLVDQAGFENPFGLRGTRLMGNFRESHFRVSEDGGLRYITFSDGETNPYGTGTYNGPFIMDATERTWADLGVPNEWFTVTYDITGGIRAHGQFAGNRANAIPAPDETGPFFFGVGVTGWGSGRNGIMQLVRNVTLHHRDDPGLNVVSAGSGFDEPTFASFPPIMSARRGAE